VNILVNNAGVQYNYNFLEEPNTLTKVQQEIEINLTAPLKLTSLLLPLLVQQESAAIINVSSSLGFVPKESAPVYCATKAGVHVFTKALRYQLDASSVKVFEMIPPLVDTAMTKGRGSGKMSPDDVVEEFWKQFQRDRYEVMIGKTKILRVLHRFLPAIAEKIVRNK
jgi:short-subunit dehydrogenase involved in D-alanine esterification of teichoic acids